MIDIENKVYTPIAQALRAAYSDIHITGDYVNVPSAFPHVSIVESDNYQSTDHLDTADRERFATVMFEVNVYSNKTSGKKSECKKIMSLIDGMMYGMNFTRISLSPIPNMENATIYRLVARYRAETDGTTIYRR